MVKSSVSRGRAPKANKLKSVEYKKLRSIGLSKIAISCYESLFQDGATNVVQLAKRLRRPRTGLYRVLKQLENKGFVTGLKTETQPVYYYAEPLDEALQRYADYQRRLVSKLINEQAAALARRRQA